MMKICEVGWWVFCNIRGTVSAMFVLHVWSYWRKMYFHPPQVTVMFSSRDDFLQGMTDMGGNRSLTSTVHQDLRNSAESSAEVDEFQSFVVLRGADPFQHFSFIGSWAEASKMLSAGDSWGHWGSHTMRSRQPSADETGSGRGRTSADCAPPFPSLIRSWFIFRVKCGGRVKVGAAAFGLLYI